MSRSDEDIGCRVHYATQALNEALSEAHDAGLDVTVEAVELGRELKTGLASKQVRVNLMRPIHLKVRADSPLKAKLDEDMLVPRRR